MGQIYCPKCGKQYAEAEKCCPECGGENPIQFKKKVKTISKAAAVIAVVLLLVASLAISIVCLNKVNSLQKQLDDVTGYLNSLQASNGSAASSGSEIYIEDVLKEDYTNHLISADNAPKEDEYFIYFHSQSCTYCLSYGNQYVVSYWAMPTEEVSEDTDPNSIKYIYDDVPVYFAEPETSESYFDHYSIESTPTIIRIVNGQVQEKGEGYEEVYNLLDEVIQRYYK